MLSHQFSYSADRMPPRRMGRFCWIFRFAPAFMGRLCAISQLLKSAGKVSCGFVLYILLPLSLQSQESAMLRGTVRDSQGNPIAGATLQLRSKEETQAQTVSADSQGNYSFAALRGGVYVLRAAMGGY